MRKAIALTAAVVLSATLLTASPASAADNAQAGVGPAVTAAPVAPVTERLAGADRYETAVAVSLRFEPGVPVAFVATGTDYPDALAASPAASRLGGPVLLTPPNRLLDGTAQELRRLAPRRIIVVGGSGAVSGGVEAALREIAPVTRLGGADRYATAEAIIAHTFPTAQSVFLATGRGYADALAASGAAGALDWPVVIADGSSASVRPSTLALMTDMGVSEIHIAGGYGAVSDRQQADLSARGFTVRRHSGSTRFETAASINDAFFDASSSRAAVLASGQDFPDALVGAALAGHLGAPLYVTMRDCVPSSILASAPWTGVGALTVLGGTGAVSETAAALQACTPPPASPALPDWAVTGWSFRTDVAPPYSDRPPYDVADPALALDPTGLRIFIRRDNLERADHAVVYAQYGISSLLEYERTGDPVWLHRAVRHGEQLISMRVLRGDAWWFPYHWPWTYDDRRLSPPWWSSMAQGQALSLFVRLGDATGERRWSVAADQTWLSFAQSPAATGPWGSIVVDGHLYLEEFAGNQPPLLVLNGQIFSLFGLYDYWKHTGDPEVARYLDGATTTVLEMMPQVRVPGGVSYYCVQPVYCQRPRWQDVKYHQIHSWQLDTLGRLTDDAQFHEWAQLLRQDWSPSSAGR